MFLGQKGTIKSELISGIFLLSFLAIFITFFATFKISEKRQIEIETFNLQKIFYDIERANIQKVEQLLFLLPSGTSYGIYKLPSKRLVSGRELIKYEQIKLGAKNIILGNELFFPSITLYQTVFLGGENYVLVLKREFDAEKELIKKDVFIFLPFAFVCLFTLTAFAFVLYKRRLLTPFELLKNAYSEVGKGSFNKRIETIGISEWDALYERFNEMLNHLEKYKKDLENTIFELSKANEALQSAQQEIVFSEKMATVGRLAAGLAHEIGNPLTSIIGYLSFMINNTQNEEDKNILSLILNETERINRIIKDLLNFARSSTFDTIKTCNPKEVVEEIIRLLAPQKEFKKTKLINNFSDNMLVQFSGEELKQVLLNLLINAIDVTPDGGSITITSYKEESFLVIAVSDEGGGVPEDIKSKIFDPFFTTKPPGKGTGLGLSVVHTLVEKYGGKVTFDNTEKGATFKIYLKRLEENIG